VLCRASQCEDISTSIKQHDRNIFNGCHGLPRHSKVTKASRNEQTTSKAEVVALTLGLGFRAPHEARFRIVLQLAVTPVQVLYSLGEVCPHRSSCTTLTRATPRTAHCFPACPHTPQSSEAERSLPHAPCACRTHRTLHTLRSSGTAAGAGPATRRTPGRHARRHHAQEARTAGFGHVANGAAGICFVADGALAFLAPAPPLPAPALLLPDPAAAPVSAPAALPHRPRHPRCQVINVSHR
jgi:hypothetical protein